MVLFATVIGVLDIIGRRLRKRREAEERADESQAAAPKAHPSRR